MKGGVRTFWLLLFCSIFFFSCKKDPQSDDTAAVNLPAHPLSSEQDLDVILNEIGDARIVLLGEASHDTAEFYDSIER